MYNLEEFALEIFSKEDFSRIKPRFEILYRVLFETITQTEQETVRYEVAEFEKECAENTLIESERYQVPSYELVLDMYSELAYNLALKRFKNKNIFVCARYLDEIFSSLLSSGLIPQKLLDEKRVLISESGIDFQYAAGKTENMSLRLYHTIS